MNSNDIRIQGLELAVQIGVPDEERAGWQVLKADIVMQPRLPFEQMQDQIGSTIDYQAVANAVRTLAASRPRHLIETLAAEITGVILEKFGAVFASVTLHKRILPGTDSVAVRIERGREAS